MAVDKLYAIIDFAGVEPGETVSLPHGLVLRGDPVQPDFATPQNRAFEIVSADTVNLVVRNTGATADCAVLVQAIHPAIRLLGLSPDDGLMTQGMTPRPFAPDAEGPAPPFPPTPVVTTIYARTTGSDTTGTGTLLNPYRTFQRAILDPPTVIPPGYSWVIDVTDIGTESFPVGYQMRSFSASAQLVTFGDVSTLPFLVSQALNIRATPQPASNIPLADTTVLGAAIVSVTGNAGTGLAIVTIGAPRASWGANALKGKMCIGSGDDASTSCTIYASDTTHLFLCNLAASVASIPQQDLFIVEPSAVFASAGAGADGGGFLCLDCSSVAFQGIGFTCAGGGQGLQIGRCNQVFLEICDIDAVSGFGIPQQFATWSSVIRTNVNVEGVAWTPRRSLVLGCAFFMLSGGAEIIRTTVFDTCDSLGLVTFAAANSQVGPLLWEITNTLVTGSTGAGGGLSMRGGVWSLQDVQINGSAGDAIQVLGSKTEALLNHVTGTTNTGFGLAVLNGGSVQVLDNGTNVSGTAGNMKVGSLATRTWVNFRTVAPIGNEYDIVSPPVAGTTGGRVFQ